MKKLHRDATRNVLISCAFSLLFFFFSFLPGANDGTTQYCLLSLESCDEKCYSDQKDFWMFLPMFKDSAS